MGYTKHIYFEDELYLLLKEEKNASELIKRLLWDYFNSIKEKEEIKKEPEVINPITIMDKSIQLQKNIEDAEMIERIQEDYRNKHPDEFIEELFVR